VTSAAWLSVSERSPTEGGDHEASDFDRLTASLDALTLLYRKPDLEKAYLGDGLGEAAAGKVIAAPMHTSVMPGAFEPEAIAAMSEAFDATCEVLHDAGPPEVVRDIISVKSR
jgi:hypothetical protein